MSRRTRILRCTGTIAAMCLAVAGCSDDADTPDPAAEAASPQPASAQPSNLALPPGVLPLPEPDADDEVVITEPGRYRVGLTDTLTFDVELPPGTSVNSDGLYLAYKETVLKVEPAGERYGVPSDPCRGFESITAAGPSVDDLLSAIRAQSIYRTGRPMPVKLDGAPGRYVEVRIPATYDASTCRDGQVGLPGNPGTSNNMPPGYVSRWWILDVDGQRTVAQAFCGPCHRRALERVTTMAESITFTPTP